MIIKEKVLVVEKIKKDYDFEGRKGTTKKIRFLNGTDIFNVKVNDDVLNTVVEGQEYLITLELKTRQEVPVFSVLEAVKVK